METKQNCCACPRTNTGTNPGLKLGHNKSVAGITTGNTETTTIVSNDAANKRFQKAMADKQQEQRAAQAKTTSQNARRKYKVSGYSFQPTRVKSLPSAPQTLFKQQQLLGMLEDFAKHMYDAITSNGINIPPSIKLGLNSGSDIRVLGHHPDQAKIESLFGNNTMLADKLHQIAFTSQVQQLDKLQSGFRNEFLNYPTNSIQQISFVHLRAVALTPFSMTIDQPGDANMPLSGTQTQESMLSYFHMRISRTTSTVASMPVSDQNMPLNRVENAGNEKDVAAEAHDDSFHPAIVDNTMQHNTAKNHKKTKDDMELPIAAQENNHKSKRLHHIHKGKLRCIINK